MKHIVSFSGGKDSTLMLLLMLEKNMKIDEVIFADTGVEFPSTYEYIERVEKYTGITIKKLKPLVTWKEQFFKIKKRGKNKGRIYGFPMANGCFMNTVLKLQPILKYYKTIQEEYLVYIGIAYNEPGRFERLKQNEKAPLYEWGINEKTVIKELKKRNLYDSHYNIFNRNGCYMCPQMGIGGARKLRKYYPEQWKELLWYSKIAEFHLKGRNSEWREGWTVSALEERFSQEEKQINIFDCL